MTEGAALTDWRAWEAGVDATPGIDRWCSGPDWVLPCHRAFAPEAEAWVVEGEHGVARLARYPGMGRSVVSGMEPMWGFACPVVSREPERFAEELVAALSGDDRWDTVVLPGFPADMSLARALGEPMAARWRIGVADGIVRLTADLSEGADAWLARRSTRFRKNLRRAERRAREAGVTIAAATEPGLHERLLAVEARSWKGALDDGLLSPGMGAFYRDLIARLAERDRLRCSVARLGGEDVGFILGGVRAGIYRGLQLSYAQDVRALSVSHLLQLHTIRELSADGVGTYELGMDMDYKRRWADEAVGTVTLVVERDG